jgi:pyruvate dehydrogenase E2 component (dihydrolipoamide acetyltransferase)
MDIRIPQLSEGVNAGTVVSILVKVGDRVERDQTVIELETDKAVAPIPTSEAGVVSKISVKEGDKVAVGHVILSLDGAAAGSAAPASAPAAAPAAAPAYAAPSTARVAAPAAPAAGAYQYSSASGFPPAASPTIRRMAMDLGIDLTRVQGTEAGGRISMGDLRAYVQHLQSLLNSPAAHAPAAQAAPAAAPAAAPKVSIDFAKWGAVEKKALTSLRKTIGHRMQESWQTIPHVTQFDEADITDLLVLRKKLAPKVEKKGGKLTVTILLLKAVVKALQKHPIFNSSLDEATEELVYKKYFNLGVAVDSEAGLIVPVLKDADKKGIAELSKELGELAEKTRSRKIAPDDLKGGSFTISNLGGIGGTFFTPIINRPEVAILALGKGVVKPVVKDDKIVARTMLPIGVSYDHRVIDGADGARFIRTLVESIEGLTEKELGA